MAHFGYFTFCVQSGLETSQSDRIGLTFRFTPGKRLSYKWECSYTIQKHTWGFDRTGNLSTYYNTTELLMQLVSTVSCNGNLLLNAGPTADGRILPVFEQRLLEMGEWLQVSLVKTCTQNGDVQLIAV